MTPARVAVAEDAERCAEVHVASWKAGYDSILPAAYLDGLRADDRLGWWLQTLRAPTDERPLHVLVVEDEDGVICGFGSTFLREDGAGAVLAQLYLHPSAWGTGAAEVLLTALLDGVQSRGVERVTLRVARDNHRARRFYERAGWTHVDHSDETESVWGVDVATVAYETGLPARRPNVG